MDDSDRVFSSIDEDVDDDGLKKKTSPGVGEGDDFGEVDPDEEDSDDDDDYDTDEASY